MGAVRAKTALQAHPLHCTKHLQHNCSAAGRQKRLSPTRFRSGPACTPPAIEIRRSRPTQQVYSPSTAMRAQRVQAPTPAAARQAHCRPRPARARAQQVAAQGKVYIDPVEKEAAAFAPATVANLGPGFDWMGCAVEVRRPLQCAGEVLLCEAQLQVCSAGALLPVARFPAVACARNGMLPRRRQPTLRPCATHTSGDG